MRPGGPGFQGVGEPEGEVSGGHDQVGADDGLRALLQDGEEQLPRVKNNRLAEKMAKSCFCFCYLEPTRLNM
jgi:hypothetical protein